MSGFENQLYRLLLLLLAVYSECYLSAFSFFFFLFILLVHGNLTGWLLKILRKRNSEFVFQ